MSWKAGPLSDDQCPAQRPGADLRRDGPRLFRRLDPRHRQRHVAELNALVMDFALPASLFVATATTSRAVLLAQWPLLLVFIVSMLALYALSYWMQRRLFGLEPSEASVQALTIALPNYAAAGLPLISAGLGPPGTGGVALSVAPGP